MIHRSIREWDFLKVAEEGNDDEIPRNAADDLIRIARALRIGGDDGEAILINGHKRLRAQQIVGVLASPSATLEILPKIDGLDAGATRHCLVHMLARVFDLEIASGSMVNLGWQRHDLLELLIRLFCDRLFEAVHRGLPRRYIVWEEDLAALRGRLDVKRQFTVLVTTPQKIACSFEDLSVDFPLNQIMKAAVMRLLKVSRAAENQRRLTELGLAFADVRAVPVAILPWDRVVLDRTNSSWATLLKLAKLLLGERFQTTSSGDARGFSLMFEMNTLFEEYVGRTLRRALISAGFDVRLQGPRNYALIGDDHKSRFATRPDIVVSRNGHPLLIVDTKWKRLKGQIDDPKRGVGQADVYQMMAYAHVYRCNRLMLLYPHHNEMREEEGILESHRVNGTEDIRLDVATIMLPDFASLGSRLKKLVLSKIEEDKRPLCVA
jgi:5-methylcytosine-specific restriction enzyme subunit McrC